MNHEQIKTLGQLVESGYSYLSIKNEIRYNLITNLQNKTTSFTGIVGYDDTVLPEVERALLSKHNILLLGLRGQAKTRIARQMTNLLNEYIPIIAGSEVNDDPFKPISKYGKKMLATHGNEMPIAWLHRNERFGEKLATPDVSIADLIGDIDPIKAANLKLSFSDEEVIHYGIIPRSNRSVFVINELPDLQARIQVALFNILEEGDIQIRGFKTRLPLDIVFVFTANPEDYTNRGSIVTPLKDRIQSQILTHYPKSIELAMAITEQEAKVDSTVAAAIEVSDLAKRTVEQLAFEARTSEYVDKKSGVSARLTISVYENMISSAERRMILNKEKNTIVWISDIINALPSVTGKIELVYEGEQEGAYQVAMNLFNKALRTLFVQYFPNPEDFKKRTRPTKAGGKEVPEVENPYKPIINWFDQGNSVNLLNEAKDATKIKELEKVKGLKETVKKYYNAPDTKVEALLMEFVLHGLAGYSLIHKNVLERNIAFSDLMSSMFTFKDTEAKADDFDDY
jgi:magnesium chelatase subunit I